MGEIVAAFGTVHAPQLIIRPPDEKPEMLDASIAAMRELGKILDETKPDVIVFLGSDHLETFSMKCIPTFAIVGGQRAIAEFAGRNYDLPIHSEFAEDPSEEGRSALFEVESGTEGVFREVHQTQHCSESAAGGDHYLYCRAVFHSDNYPAWDSDCAGGAYGGVGAGDL